MPSMFADILADYGRDVKLKPAPDEFLEYAGECQLRHVDDEIDVLSKPRAPAEQGREGPPTRPT